MNAEKIKAIAECIEPEAKIKVAEDGSLKTLSGCLWVNLRFNPYEYWSHSGMVLEWLEEKCVRHEWSIGINRDYSTETTHQVIVRSECFDVVVKGEGSTLQEAICEAAYQVIKGE